MFMLAGFDGLSGASSQMQAQAEQHLAAVRSRLDALGAAASAKHKTAYGRIRDFIAKGQYDFAISVAKGVLAEMGMPTGGALKPQFASYTVKRGDTLGTIAKAAYGDSSLYSTIYAYNQNVIGDSPNLIRPGMKLTMPTTRAPDAIIADVQQRASATMPASAAPGPAATAPTPPVVEPTGIMARWRAMSRQQQIVVVGGGALIIAGLAYLATRKTA